MKWFRGLGYFLSVSWRCSKAYILALAAIELLQAVIATATVTVPGTIIDALFVWGDWRMAARTAGVFIGALWLVAQATHLLRRKAANSKETVRKHFETDIAKTLMTCDYYHLDDPAYRNMRTQAMQFIQGEWNQFGVVLEHAFTAFGRLTVLIGMVGIIATSGPIVLLVFLILTVFNAWVNSKLKNKRKELLGGFSQVIRRRAYFEDITQSADYAKEIRVNNLTNWLLSKYQQYMDIFCGKAAEIHKTDLIYKAVVAITTLIQQGSLYGYLVYSVAKGTCTLGQFTVYISAITLFGSAMNELIDKVLEINKFNVYYDAYKAYMDVTYDTCGGNIPAPRVADGVHITFRNVSFKYPGAENYTLCNINVDIATGQHIAIVGENGAGKTTFIKLLLRLYRPSDGSITLNGQDIFEYDYAEYMQLLSVVAQDFKLFAWPLYENIALRPHAEPDAATADIAASLGLEDWIDSLAAGLDTEMHKDFSDQGVEPSGGMGQKIAIARALYKNAPLVVMDEPTSTLDPRAEADIYAKMHDLARGKTALFISHRLSSAQFCDLVLVFHSGALVETGDHQALMARQGLYAELFAMQAKWYA